MARRAAFLVAVLLLPLAGPRAAWSDLLNPCRRSAPAPEAVEQTSEEEAECAWDWQLEDAEVAAQARRGEAREARTEDLRERADELRDEALRRRPEFGREELAPAGSNLDLEVELPREWEEALQRDPLADAVKRARRSGEGAKEVEPAWHRDPRLDPIPYPDHATLDQRHRSQVRMKQRKGRRAPSSGAYHRSWAERRKLLTRREGLPKSLRTGPDDVFRRQVPPSRRKSHQSYPGVR